MMTATMYEMTLADPRRGVAGWLDRLGRVPLSIHQLLFRLGVASVFLKAGMVKISSWESTVALFRDELAPPLGGPAVEVCAVAKRDLKQGEMLDEYGMYMTYGEAVNADEMSTRRYLPEGLVEGCRLRRDVAQDDVLTYDDVELPPNRLADQLRAEQYEHFRGEGWLTELVAAGAGTP